MVFSVFVIALKVRWPISSMLRHKMDCFEVFCMNHRRFLQVVKKKNVS
jgi:hypothetical protein